MLERISYALLGRSGHPEDQFIRGVSASIEGVGLSLWSTQAGSPEAGFIFACVSGVPLLFYSAIGILNGGIPSDETLKLL